jgi:lactate dehydrogenase-like 2-hydroxyacid dehydrogenase
MADCVQAVDGEWDIPRLTKDAYDLKGKTVGTVAAGRIGCHVIKRLKVACSCCMQRMLSSLSAA